MLENASLNSYIKIKIDADFNLRYGFMAIGACIDGLNKYMWSIVVVVVDRTFIK